MKLLATLLVFLFLESCSHLKRPPAPTRAEGSVAAVSLLGSDFHTDALQKNSFGFGQVLDVEKWKVNETLAAMLMDASRERGREARVLLLDPHELEEVQSVRESRFSKTLSAYPQALLDFLLKEAKKQGARNLLLVLPREEQPRFALKKGPMGLACDDPKGKKGRAFPYFLFDFSVWDVEREKRIFQYNVDPAVTEALTFAECSEARQLSEPARQLEDPVKRSLALVVDALFDKLGWRKPARP